MLSNYISTEFAHSMRRERVEKSLDAHESGSRHAGKSERAQGGMDCRSSSLLRLCQEYASGFLPGVGRNLEMFPSSHAKN
jgi:hypothetical protein